MENLQSINFEKLVAIYDKFFFIGFLNNDLGDKLACIALICYITNELNKKGKKINCYEVLLQIGKDLPDKTFLKSLGAICQSLMYGCNKFPDFGIAPKDMPKTVKKLLSDHCPF